MKTQGTEFQEKAWQALKAIPHGKTIFYQDQSLLIGNENYTRAVGNANHVNPLSIILPCHRVLGNSGKLIGYTSGIKLKQALLNLEELEGRDLLY